MYTKEAETRFLLSVKKTSGSRPAGSNADLSIKTTTSLTRNKLWGTTGPMSTL
jgi:hypothetical protein